VKSLILSLVCIGLFVPSLFGQPATSVDLTNMGGFNNSYTYVRTDNIGLSPDGNTYVSHVYSAGPTVMGGIPQFFMTVYENVATGQRGLSSLSDKQAPWLTTASIGWNPDGSRIYANGYASSLDESTYSIFWEGGGMGPGYAGGGTEEDSSLFAAAQRLASGLIFENGEWRVLP
jgi:hypothetical protein